MCVYSMNVKIMCKIANNPTNNDCVYEIRKSKDVAICKKGQMTKEYQTLIFIFCTVGIEYVLQHCLLNFYSKSIGNYFYIVIQFVYHELSNLEKKDLIFARF